MRYPHALRGNKSTEGPQNIIVFDTETYPDDCLQVANAKLHRLRLGCAIAFRLEGGVSTRRRCITFSTAREFHEFVYQRLTRHRQTYIFAHNLGFDATVVRLWLYLERGDYKLVSLCAESPPTIIRTRTPDCKATWVDTLNYFDCSLQKLGESFGVEKLTMPRISDPNILWEHYCMRDAEILEAAVLGLLLWHRGNDLGVFRSTAAGMSLQAYRHRFMKVPIEIHAKDSVTNLERDSYYCGVAEPYYIGPVLNPRDEARSFMLSKGKASVKCPCGPVYHLDVNGMYPYVMLMHTFPHKLRTYGSMIDKETLRNEMEHHAAVASVLIHSQDEVFPIRLKRGTFMVRGRFWTTLAGPELQRALDHYRVVQVASFALYDRAMLFTDFVAEFWRKRVEAQERGSYAEDRLCKMILCSLYGKFAQRSFQWVELTDETHDTPWDYYSTINAETGQVVQRRVLAWLVQEEQPKGDAQHAFPAISSYVTSYAREYMADLRQRLGKQNVFYNAVDAVFVNQEGYERALQLSLVDNYQIGKMKLVGTYQDAEFRGMHNYDLDGIPYISGRKKNALQQGVGMWEQDEFQSLAGILSGRPQPGVIVRRVVIDRYNTRLCGIKDHDGWITPYFINAENYDG